MTTVVRSGVLKLSLSLSLTHIHIHTLPFSSSLSIIPKIPSSSLVSFRHPFSHSTPASAKTTNPTPPSPISFETQLFIPPGIEPHEVNDSILLPGSNIAVGPYAGDSRIKEVEFVKSSSRAKDCPRDDRPEFAVLGRSNVGKSSLINSLVRKKEIALTSKKPG